MKSVFQISYQVRTGFNLINKEEWLKIPKIERAEMLTSGKIKFLDEMGGVIPVSKGLRALKKDGWLE